MEQLNIPNTLIHGDMNQGNILADGSHCRFTDWSEAYLGNPFTTFQHLLLLNVGEHREITDHSLKRAYKHFWMRLLDPIQIDQAFVLMPLLAIVSYLYGRGDWLSSPICEDPHRKRYARSLARHMDHAARAPELMEALRV
jgi:Ser/Thr protein kinase RdoA (MazF antagonist)